MTNHWGESMRNEFGDGEASAEANKGRHRTRCARATEPHLRSSANPAFPFATKHKARAAVLEQDWRSIEQITMELGENWN